MASPVVEEVVESANPTANSTTHTVALPTATAGQLLLIIANKGASAASDITNDLGLTDLLDEAGGNGLYIAYKWMDGTEPASGTLTTSASTRLVEIAYRISGAENPATQPPEIGTTATGTSTTPDPPAAVMTGGSKDYLVIAFFGQAGEQADDDTLVTTFPTNYTLGQAEKTCGTVGTNLGGMIGAAARAMTASSENPGTFTSIDNAAWKAQTITIHPATAVNATATPSTVAAVAAVPAATARSDNTASPGTVAGIAAVPAPTARGAAVTAPATVAALAAVPDPVASGGAGGNATASPGTVAAAAAVPAPTARGAGSTSPATVAALAAVPAPTGLGAARVSLAAVAAVAQVPASIARGAAIISPATVAAIGQVPAPSASAGTNGTASPSAVAAVTTIPAPTVSGTARATPATVAALAAVPAPAASSSNIANPARVAAVATMPAPTVRGGAIATPATVAAIVTIPAPSFPSAVQVFITEGDADALAGMESDSGKASSIEGGTLIGVGLES